MSDTTLAVYNPKNVPIDELPAIYGFNNGGAPGWYNAVLVADSGHCLGGHMCSDEYFVPRDLGCYEGYRPDRHATFREHYPDGYRMVYVPRDQVQTHEGLDLACRRNQLLGEASSG